MLRLHNLHLDFKLGVIKSETILFRAGEMDSNAVSVTMTNDGVPINLDTYTPRFEATKPDGTFVVDDGSLHNNLKIIEAQKGRFLYVFPAEAYSAEGRNTAYFSFSKQDAQYQYPTDIITSPSFTYQALRNATDGAVESGDYVPQFEALAAQINALADEMQTRLNDLEVEFQSAEGTLGALVQDATDQADRAESEANRATAEANQFDIHANNADIHVTLTDKENWNDMIPNTEKGQPSGVATLEPDGKVTPSQLRSTTVPDASTTQKGIVQLEDSTNSTSITTAATPKSVKDVADRVGTLASLNTTNKASTVAAINELFQFANDGKAKWSSVIGSPLVSTDTFADMQTKTQTIKNTLATNLTAKGQTSTGTETLSALANKVSNISSGKQSKTGTVTAGSALATFEYQFNTNTNTLNFVEVTGLTFKPSKIIIRSAGAVSQSLTIYEIIPEYTSGSSENVTMLFANSNSSSNSIFQWKANARAGYVTNTGFKVPVYSANATYTYTAYE